MLCLVCVWCLCLSLVAEGDGCAGERERFFTAHAFIMYYKYPFPTLLTLTISTLCKVSHGIINTTYIPFKFAIPIHIPFTSLTTLTTYVLLNAPSTSLCISFVSSLTRSIHFVPPLPTLGGTKKEKRRKKKNNRPIRIVDNTKKKTLTH